MEIYSYGSAQALLQPSLYKANRATSLEIISKSDNLNSKGHKASLYIPEPETKRLVKGNNGASGVSGNLDKLNAADTYIEKLQAMLNKLKETNIPEIGKEISHLKDGLKEVLDKFPMLTATITKVANWDIKTLLGGKSDDINNVLKQMREEIAFMQVEVKASGRKELVGTGSKENAEEANTLLSSLNGLNGLNGSKERTLHNNISTTRVVDLIT